MTDHLPSPDTEAAGVADPEPAGRPIPRDPDALLFGAEAAYLLGLSIRTLESLRLQGGGPTYCKLNRSCRYRRADVLGWAAERIRRSTSDRGQAA
jgi:Helix-turn-helix domain